MPNKIKSAATVSTLCRDLDYLARVPPGASAAAPGGSSDLSRAFTVY
jgi:hypothetical protein